MLSPRQLDRQVRAAFEQKDYAGAVAAIEEYRAHKPKDPVAAYNLACARAMMGRVDDAAELLLDAITLGFTDFHAMERDEHLGPLQAHPKFKLVLRGWRELLDARGSAELESMRAGLGESYIYERDEALRLNFASSFPRATLDEAHEELRRTARWSREHVFGDTPADESRPDPWVSIAMPTPADFESLVLGVSIGGYYDNAAKRLVTRDLGPSLRHEFFHALHWRDMARRGQEHPLWVMEGLACILEDVDLAPDGSYRPVPSWRTNIVRRLALNSGLVPWETLFRWPRERFMAERVSANYAQSRAFFVFLLERGELREWYRAFADDFRREPTGLGAIETVFAKPVRDVEREFREWARSLPEVAEVAKPGTASLGIEAAAGDGEGPVVKRVKRERVDEAGMYLKPKDVILAVEDRVVRTLDDLSRVLGEYEVGDQVILDVKRSKLRLRIKVELAPQDEKQFW